MHLIFDLCKNDIILHVRTCSANRIKHRITIHILRLQHCKSSCHISLFLLLARKQNTLSYHSIHISHFTIISGNLIFCPAHSVRAVLHFEPIYNFHIFCLHSRRTPFRRSDASSEMVLSPIVGKTMLADFLANIKCYPACGIRRAL